ncbi:DNA-binding protein [Echinicola strongylocentroti]|uniref:DNA-binding protein n=1 Tax=Echinicola strongylocentroti TaxID=1795355 RepID=A0A2Z4IDK7_9BACT|nr:Fic family protein [Echinicola strongylocentroti]AWW29112.1 DNA-binding protein [Echinicola strongylocentroti]
MKTLAQILQEAREKKGFTLKDAVKHSGVDAGLISKFERGKRMPSAANLKALSEAYGLSFAELKKQWLAEKVLDLVQYEVGAAEILTLAESRVEYLAGEKALVMDKIPASVQEKLEEIDQLKEQWQQRRPLGSTQLQKMKEYFNVAYTFESNRIEGNTLTLQETHLVVNEGITIGGKSMREHLEAINHSEAVDYLEELIREKADIYNRSLLELHYLILKGIDRENAGKYRSVPVRIAGSEHVPPQPYLVDKMMEDYFVHYQEQKNVLHPVLLAAEMHERLVSIHPFVDGNGRTSRLIMNLVLVGNGYTIANLKGDQTSRLAYYKALEAVQVNNDPVPFYQLVADAVKDSLQQHLEMV